MKNKGFLQLPTEVFTGEVCKVADIFLRVMNADQKENFRA